MYRSQIVWVLLIITVVALGGCTSTQSIMAPAGISIASRGESLSVTQPPTPVVLPALIVEVTEEPILGGEDSDDCVLSENLQYEAEGVALINDIRIKAGLGRLSEHALLSQVARQHSKEMACGGFLSHDSPTGGTAVMRIGSAGYKFTSVGENIAMGYATPAEVVEAWLASAGHSENLLGEDFTQIGIGFAQLEGDEQTRYWTIILASPAKP